MTERRRGQGHVGLWKRNRTSRFAGQAELSSLAETKTLVVPHQPLTAKHLRDLRCANVRRDLENLSWAKPSMRVRVVNRMAADVPRALLAGEHIFGFDGALIEKGRRGERFEWRVPRGP